VHYYAFLYVYNLIVIDLYLCYLKQFCYQILRTGLQIRAKARAIGRTDRPLMGDYKNRVNVEKLQSGLESRDSNHNRNNYDERIKNSKKLRNPSLLFSSSKQGFLEDSLHLRKSRHAFGSEEERSKTTSS